MAPHPSLAFRRLRADEWEVLRDVRLRALATDPAAFVATHADEVLLDDLTWRARMASGQLAALDPDGRAVAMAAVIPVEGEPCHRELVGVWVDPAVRGAGVARTVIELAVGWAGDAGATEVTLRVLEGNGPARALYTRCGFVETGERTRRPGAAEDEVRMRRPLHPASPGPPT